MGSPISGLIAEAVLQRLESLGFRHHRPKFWARFVDDTFVVIERDRVLEFKEHLKAIFPDIQFTMEEEENNQLAFLDVLVCRKDCGGLKTKDAQLHIFNESGLVEEAILAIRAQIREIAALPADPELLDPAAADTAAGGLNLKLRPTPLTLSERRVAGGADSASSGVSVAGMSIATGSAALSYAAACPLLPSEASLRSACGGFKSSQLSLSSTASSAFSGLTGAVIGGGGGGIGVGGCADTGQTSSALNGSASTLHSTPATNTSGPACGRSPPFTPPPPQQSFSGVTSPGDSTGAGGDALSLFDAHNADMMSLNSSNSTGFEAPDRTSRKTSPLFLNAFRRLPF
ncbi:hypothetical protein SprV_0802569800 [Sparganum proliferum]